MLYQYYDGLFVSVVNSTLAILKLDTWSQESCPVLYFVIEYKLAARHSWTVGTEYIFLIEYTLAPRHSWTVGT